MANFVVFASYLCQVVESIQARRIRVELSIADQKPEGKNSRKCKEIGSLQEFCRVAKISQPVEFRKLRNFASCEISQPMKIRSVAKFASCHRAPHATVHLSCHCSPFLLFDILTIFVIFPNLPFMYNGYLRCFCNFAYFEHHISSDKFL